MTNIEISIQHHQIHIQHQLTNHHTNQHAHVKMEAYVFNCLAEVLDVAASTDRPEIDAKAVRHRESINLKIFKQYKMILFCLYKVSRLIQRQHLLINHPINNHHIHHHVLQTHAHTAVNVHRQEALIIVFAPQDTPDNLAIPTFSQQHRLQVIEIKKSFTKFE